MITPDKFKENVKEAEASWSGSYSVVEKLIKEKGLKIGAEIGVGYGGNAFSMLSIPTIEKLYEIDPYGHKEDIKDTINFQQDDFEYMYQFVIKRLSPFGNKFKFIRKTSSEAVNLVPDNLDFVYIDGEHFYEGVFNDLCNWTKKVKVGGIIAGHDYNHPELPGVKKAIDEFFRRFNWEIHTEDNYVWWVEKKPLNISFFIPTYNYGKSIRPAVESIMKDNFSKGDELIIVNDGSTDDTAKNLLELKSEYPEIQIINHIINKGPSATRNDAVENCQNPILFSLDHDNILAPGSIKKLKEFLINTGLDVAAFGEMHYFSDNTRNVVKKWVFKEGLFKLEDALNGSYFPGASGNYMFTKESWIRAGRYPDSWLDSWGFGIRQIATGSKMMALPKTFYFHQFRNEHGYESTYVKGVRTGRISSLVALQIMIPFLRLLKRRSANYIMSERGRNVWFEKLSKKPLHVKYNTLAEYEQSVQKRYIKLYLSKFISKGKYLARKIKNSLKKITKNG